MFLDLHLHIYLYLYVDMYMDLCICVYHCAQMYICICVCVCERLPSQLQSSAQNLALLLSMGMRRRHFSLPGTARHHVGVVG